MPEKQLPDLFKAYDPISPVPDVKVSGIAIDSRQVQPGDLFFAVVDKADRYNFLDEVVARGAVAVVGERPQIAQKVPYVQVADDRQAMAYASAAFYDHPARQLTMIGVTGTDGKTTTANLIYHILQAADVKAGMISTVNALIGDAVLDTGFHVTTPEAMETQGYLRQMVDAGLTHAILEMTSHGLTQWRGAMADEFDIAVLTNITHEHLDYHGSYEAYRAAKARLFTHLGGVEKPRQVSPFAVLNRDDVSYAYLSEVTAAQQISYGYAPEADLRASEVHSLPSGLRFSVQGADFETVVDCKLVGDYNVPNCLAAIGATVFGLGVKPETARVGIVEMPGVPGRMELIDMGQEFLALVDFAHTPNGLRQALKAARGLTEGRVIAVFGSAGLRDRAKRRMMAEVSTELADLTVLTAEDPRTESLRGILAEMATGAEGRGGVEGKTFWRVPDRGEALRFAVKQAQPGDLVIVLGKGHEQSMCFGETEYPWDDRIALRAALAEHLGVDGPEMPQLPTPDD